MDGFSHFVIQMHCLPVPWHESYPRTKKLSCILTIFFHFAFSCVIMKVIDTFINRIYLYDDKLIITFNHKDGAETITLNDIETALTEQEDGSDLVSSAVPRAGCPIGDGLFLFVPQNSNSLPCCTGAFASIQIESPSGARFRGLEGDFSYFSGISPPSPGCTHFAVSVTVPPETKSSR